MELVNLILVVILIALTGFFVATEFAIVKIRSTRIDQLVAEGRRGSLAAKEVTTHLDEYLSACQLGITVTAMGLGWLGEPTVERLLHPLFVKWDLNDSISHLLSFGIAFVAMTYLHVVVGELAPKTVAIQKAETITLLFARPIIWFYKLMYPFIWLLNGSARVLVGVFGMKPASEHEVAHSEEELRLLLSESYQSGEINQNELKPIVNGDKDDILGMINIKEILTARLVNESSDMRLESFIHPVIRVIETIAIRDLLVKMQKERIHMAILLDEYGGTSGLVTVEDILEEIVGEIRDEFDADEIPDIRKLKDNHYILSAKLIISEVNDLLGTNLSDDIIDTLGGWFLSKHFTAKTGDKLVEDGYCFKVVDMSGHTLKYIEVTKAES